MVVTQREFLLLKEELNAILAGLDKRLKELEEAKAPAKRTTKPKAEVDKAD